jgi:hypothetical protein
MHATTSNATQWLTKAASVAFGLAVVASCTAAGMLLYAGCEGFSCGYLGIAWIAWVTLFFLPLLGLGIWARTWTNLPPLLLTAVKATFNAHLITAAILMCIWVIRAL